MKIWCPPTPPQDDSDVYMDYTSAYLYETKVMDESRLPPVFVRKELKRVLKESVHVQPDDGNSTIDRNFTQHYPSPSLVRLYLGSRLIVPIIYWVFHLRDQK